MASVARTAAKATRAMNGSLFWWRRKEQQPKFLTRMTAEQVVTVAQSAIPESEMVARSLANAHPEQRSDAIVWTVRSMTIGAFVRIEVDDATGKVIGRHDYGGR